MKVKFCEKNKWTDAVSTSLTQTHPNIKISTKKCIGKCHRCKEHPIAMVNKKILVGTDEEDLLNLIIAALLE
jgi:uncharacterized protein YuzB (UPF0349 family)